MGRSLLPGVVQILTVKSIFQVEVSGIPFPVDLTLPIPRGLSVMWVPFRSHPSHSRKSNGVVSSPRSFRALFLPVGQIAHQRASVHFPVSTFHPYLPWGHGPSRRGLVFSANHCGWPSSHRCFPPHLFGSPFLSCLAHPSSCHPGHPPLRQALHRSCLVPPPKFQLP